VLLAVAEQENGSARRWVRNTNGSYDVGTMQFNTAYVRTLARYGIGLDAVAAPGCYAYDLAAWRLHQSLLHDSGDLWTRVANYNSRTPQINARYRARVMARGAAWGQWLLARWPQMPLAPASEAVAAVPVTVTYHNAHRSHAGPASMLRYALLAPTSIAANFGSGRGL
ncbi:MAG: muramidase, partial [Janthinobacterium lividum]